MVTPEQSRKMSIAASKRWAKARAEGKAGRPRKRVTIAETAIEALKAREQERIRQSERDSLAEDRCEHGINAEECTICAG